LENAYALNVIESVHSIES